MRATVELTEAEEGVAMSRELYIEALASREDPRRNKERLRSMGLQVTEVEENAVLHAV